MSVGTFTFPLLHVFAYFLSHKVLYTTATMSMTEVVDRNRGHDIQHFVLLYNTPPHTTSGERFVMFSENRFFSLQLLVKRKLKKAEKDGKPTAGTFIGGKCPHLSEHHVTVLPLMDGWID